jgi:MYXO-CTERM domain-containing protein
LRVTSSDASASTHEPKFAHYAFGLAVLAALFALVTAGRRRQPELRI